MNTLHNYPKQNRKWQRLLGILLPALLGGLLISLGRPQTAAADLGDQFGWVSAESDNTYSVAWGDVDGDGDLDLAVGNNGAPNKLYLNKNGTLAATAGWVSAEADYTSNVAWGDVDGDGDLDLAVGNSGGQPNKLYLNEGRTLAVTAGWVSAEADDTYSVAWGDVDGDGDLDLAVGKVSTQPIKLYLNQLQSPQQAFYGNSLSSAVAVKLQSEPVSTFAGTTVDLASANFYAHPGIRQGIIPISYTLFHPTSQLSGLVEAYYSLNGGGDWREAVPTAETPLNHLAQAPFPAETATNTHVFEWDTFASGFFGQSDNVVFRLELHPNLSPTNGTPTFQRPYIATQTYPFRVRGTQVQVYSETVAPGNQQPDALVYRLPAAGGDGLIADSEGQPYRTDQNGYLQGRGALGIGDQLVALLPVTMIPVATTDTYTHYHTSATVGPTSLVDPFTVQTPGVQQIVVSADNSLVVFDLDISLEWDARGDAAYMERLAADVRLAAERFYDITDGQATLGTMRVFHNKESWLTADVQIYASNNMRPNADLGGSATAPMGLTLSNGDEIANAFLPGQVRMPITWNRFGRSDGTIGEDWPRAFAHELAHYFLFVPDNYLGIDGDGRLIQTDCRGSVMTDAYRPDYSEFLTAAEWASDPACLQTVAALTTGWSDWETVLQFYPFLKGTGGNAGPVRQPLAALTDVLFIDPATPADPAEIDQVTLVDEQGGIAVVPPSGVHSYQFETNGTPNDPTDDRIIPIGVPIGGFLGLRGGHAGDQVCVLDNSGATRRSGCNDGLSLGNASVTLHDTPDWQPDIRVSPVLPDTPGGDPCPW